MTFLFGKPHNKLLIGSWFIQQAEGLHFSHCAVKIESTVYESVFPKVRTIPYSDWLKKYELVEMYVGPTLSDEEKQDYIVIHKEIESDPYSLKQILIIWLGIIGQFFSIAMNGKEINGQRAWICSEYMGLMQSVFFEHRFGKHLDFLSLKDVRSAAAEIASKHGWKVYKF